MRFKKIPYNCNTKYTRPIFNLLKVTTVKKTQKKEAAKAPAKKAAVKAPAKKTAVKAPAKKTAVKAPAKKVTAKAPAKKVAVKAPAKKVVAKAPAKKVVAKAPAKKAVVKAPAKKTAVKAPAKKVVAKAPAKKVAVKAPEKKVVAKAPVKKAPAKAPETKTVVKAPVKKPVQPESNLDKKIIKPNTVSTKAGSPVVMTTERPKNVGVPASMQHKRRLVVSYSKMKEEVAAAFKEKYPKGYSDYMGDLFRVEPPIGDPFYAITLETEDSVYLIKMVVNVDKAEDAQKSLFPDADASDDIPTEGETFPDDNTENMSDSDDDTE